MSSRSRRRLTGCRAARGSGKEIAEFVILQDSVNRPELIIPPFVTVRPEPLEDAA
jgi:hypothetical protein